MQGGKPGSGGTPARGEDDRDEQSNVQRRGLLIEDSASRDWVDVVRPTCTKSRSSSPLSPDEAASVDRPMCELISTEHRPLYVSPKDVAMLRLERQMSYSELGNALYPLGVGNCCWRQNTQAPRNPTSSERRERL